MYCVKYLGHIRQHCTMILRCSELLSRYLKYSRRAGLDRIPLFRHLDRFERTASPSIPRSPCRAIERLMASAHMRAFSIPFNEDEIVLTRIVPDADTSDLAPLSSVGNTASSDPSMSSAYQTFHGRFQVRHDWAVSTADPNAAQIAPSPSATSPLHTKCDLSGTGFNSEHMAHGGNPSGYLASGVAATSPETSLMLPQVVSDGVLEETEENDIGAADWLDVTHALLDVVDRPT